jgi:hypothetical protein
VLLHLDVRPRLRAAKVLTKDQIDDIEREAAISRQLRTDGAVVAEGRRLCNRDDRQDKENFVRTFLAERRVDAYYSQDEFNMELPATRTAAEALSELIVIVFQQLGVKPPASARVLATRLLFSDGNGRLNDLEDEPLQRLSVDLVLAHVEAMGYGLPQRISMGVAKVATLVLLNRGRFADGQAR